VRLLKDIIRVVEAFLNYYEDFIKTKRLLDTFSEKWSLLFRNVISITFEDFFREIEASSKAMWGFFHNVYVAFKRPIAAKAFWFKPAPGKYKISDVLQAAFLILNLKTAFKLFSLLELHIFSNILITLIIFKV
jgi:hypothetical protein